MPRFIADALAGWGYSFFRWWLLSHSDKGLAARFRFLQRVIYAFSGDEFLRNVMGEMAEIFDRGGPEAAMVKKMFRVPDKEYSVAIIKAGLRKD